MKEVLVEIRYLLDSFQNKFRCLFIFLKKPYYEVKVVVIVTLLTCTLYNDVIARLCAINVQCHMTSRRHGVEHGIRHKQGYSAIPLGTEQKTCIFLEFMKTPYAVFLL